MTTPDRAVLQTAIFGALLNAPDDQDLADRADYLADALLAGPLAPSPGADREGLERLGRRVYEEAQHAWEQSSGRREEFFVREFVAALAPLLAAQPPARSATPPNDGERWEHRNCEHAEHPVCPARVPRCVRCGCVIEQVAAAPPSPGGGEGIPEGLPKWLVCLALELPAAVYDDVVPLYRADIAAARAAGRADERAAVADLRSVETANSVRDQLPGRLLVRLSTADVQDVLVALVASRGEHFDD